MLAELDVLAGNRPHQHGLQPLAPELALQRDIDEPNRLELVHSNASIPVIMLHRRAHGFDEARTTSEHGRRLTPLSLFPAIISSRLSPASRPSAFRFMSTLVSCGRAASAITSQLSKPTIATSSGTASPISRKRIRRTACDLIVAAEDRVGFLWPGQQPGRSFPSPRLGPHTLEIKAVDLGQSGLGKGRAVAVAPETHGLEMLGSRDMGDALPAERRQMGNGQHGAAFVVGKQRERSGVVCLREDVDDRQAMCERADRSALVCAARCHHESVDAFSQQLVEMLALAFGIISGVAHEHRYAGFGQPLLESFDDRKGEPTETVIGDDADRARLRPMQALRQVVRAIADLARDAHHLFARVLAQSATSIERFRCRTDRDIREARDVAYGRSPAESEGRRKAFGRRRVGVLHAI